MPDYQKNIITLLAVIIAALFYYESSRKNTVVTPGRPAVEIFDSINSRNSLAKSIFYGKITGISMVHSSLLYKKPDLFLFETYLLNKKKAEVASNGETYWFWMEEFKKDSLFFCPIKKIESTRVKPALHPFIIQGLSWINEINPEGAYLDKNGLAVVTNKEGSYSKTLVADEQKLIEQHFFKDGSPVLSVTVSQFYEIEGVFLPKNMRLIWHEEGKSADIKTEMVSINSKNPVAAMPKGLEMINLEDY
jgi:hypothetical protein